MPIDPNADTHSPWYECFEPQALVPTPSSQRLAAAPSTTAADATNADDTDGAAEALFDYYNA